MEPDIYQIIDQKIAQALTFASKKYGDTPTDALQLVPKKYVDARPPTVVYYGKVDSGGTAITLPAGWSSAKSATGDYVVTHNLGTTAYGVVANATTTFGIVEMAAIGTSTFEVEFTDHNANPANTGFVFILIPS